jgi:processive 1,2-diacylglycerol beta-glucosyltransferase
MPLRLFGFVETMHELMQASDLLVTKAGGLTVMEALALGLPMVFCGTIPGQERPNADYVVQHGAGVMAKDAKDVIDTVLRLLDAPHELASMRSRAMALSRPRAAEELVERLIVASQ